MRGHVTNCFERSVKDMNGAVTVAETRGYITKNVYDGYDRAIKLLYPDATPANDNDNLHEEFTYDLASRKVTSRTRAGQVLTFGYDDLDRTIFAHGRGATAPSPTTSPAADFR